MIRNLRCPNCGAALDPKIQKTNVIQCDYCQTNHLIEPRVHSPVGKNSHQFASKLYKVIDENFGLDELEDLVMRLNQVLPGQTSLDYDDIPGTSQKSKARELVLWCRRRAVLQSLADTVLSVRPSIDLS